MTLPKLEQFAEKVADLPDKPNAQLTAAELKAKFDAAPEELRVFLNNVIEKIESDYATKQALADLVLGEILDGSLTDEKLSNEPGQIKDRLVKQEEEMDVVKTETEGQLSKLRNKLDKNFYDDYQLWLELYYKGVISNVDTYNAKAVAFDGFTGLEDFVESEFRTYSGTPSASNLVPATGADEHFMTIKAASGRRAIKGVTIPFTTTGSWSGYYFIVKVYAFNALGLIDTTNVLFEGNLRYDSVIKLTNLREGSGNVTRTIITTGNEYYFDFNKLVELKEGVDYAIGIKHGGTSSDGISLIYYSSSGSISQYWKSIGGATPTYDSTKDIVMKIHLVSSDVGFIYGQNNISTGVDGVKNFIKPTSISGGNTTIYDNNPDTYYQLPNNVSGLSSHNYLTVPQTFTFGDPRVFSGFEITLGESYVYGRMYWAVKIEYSLDGVNYRSIDHTTSYNGSGSTTGWYRPRASGSSPSYEVIFIPFIAPVVAKYLRINYMMHTNGSTDSTYLRIYEMSFQSPKAFESNFEQKTKPLSYTAEKAELYLSVDEHLQAHVIPFVSFNGGSSYNEMILVNEVNDLRLGGNYKERKYEVAGSGSNIKLKLNFKTDVNGYSLSRVSRYGLIVS